MYLILLLISCVLIAAHNHDGHQHDNHNRGSAITHGKHFCGVHDLTELELAHHEADFSNALAMKESSLVKDGVSGEAKKKWKDVTIPVYFHVIKSSAGEGQVGMKAIRAQIAVLNSNYSGTGFKFQFKEVSYHVNDEWFYQGDNYYSAEVAMKEALRVGDSKTLNVYTAYLTGGVLGWATFPMWYKGAPKMDGVVMDYGVINFGELEDYNSGKVLVHEVGHWVGLYHTFQGGCNANVAQGDGVADTPAERTNNRACSNVGRNTCPGVFFPGNDPIDNHMDYSDEPCRTTFTKGQIERMKLQYTAYRA